MTSKEVRDPIHGLLVLSDREWRIVDSPAFQRLRDVQQLAFTHLVYPGARHSRFEHCIGAAHIAGRLAESMDAGDPELLRAAGLCHDLGHGPFSHVSEMVYEHRTGRHHIHEAISAAIVRYHKPIRKALGKATSDWVAELLSGTGHGKRRTFERDVIAGPADIDKLDYLLRDSHYCGVDYGRFDMHKVVESARRVEDLGGTYLGFHEEGVYAVEGLLLARYHMHRQVYGHRTRIATDKMLVRAMSLGVDEGLLPEGVFAPPEDLDGDFVEEYLTWDDSKVISTLFDAPDGSKSKEMMQSLKDRRLLKQLAQVTHAQLEAKLGLTGAGNAVRPQGLESVLPEAEAHVAAAAGVDPTWVVLHWEDLKSPLSSRDSVLITESQVPMVMRDETIQPFNQLSDIFGSTEPAPRLSVSAYVRPPAGVVGKRKLQSVEKALIEAMELVAENSVQM